MRGSDEVFRRAVPDFFAGGPAIDSAKLEAAFLAALKAKTSSVASIAAPLAAWLSSARFDRMAPGLNRNLFMVSTALTVARCRQDRWEPELIVSHVRELAARAGITW